MKTFREVIQEAKRGKQHWVDYFVNYSDNNKQRTTKTKRFDKLQDAKKFVDGSGASGYITSLESEGFEEPIPNFIMFFGEFNPSSQSMSEIGAFLGGDVSKISKVKDMLKKETKF